MGNAACAPMLFAAEGLQGLPESQIQWLHDHGDYLELDAGAKFIEQDDPVTHMYIVLQGSFSFFRQQGSEYVEAVTIGPGAISGVLPFSRAQNATAAAITKEPSVVYRLAKEHFRGLAAENYELTERLVHQMTNRVRDFTTRQLHSEKLMALGKISAGLAHELNNPTAALVRSAEELQNHLPDLPAISKELAALQLPKETFDQANAIMFAKIEQGPAKFSSLLARNQVDDEVVDWLEDYGLNADQWAEPLVDFGFTEDDLRDIVDLVGDDFAPKIVTWMANHLVLEQMVTEIKEAGRRISELVTSIKSYSHMDRGAEKVEASLEEGLDSTLKIMAHKVRNNKVELKKDYGLNGATVCINPGEINQVFTNIIDNALDAMEEQGGTLALTTKATPEEVVVELSDTGPGIPEDIRQKVFDPFFTTKEVGKGTGMGLEVVKKILDNHSAAVEIDSQPGATTFRIRFPR